MRRMKSVKRPIATGSVTLANMKISAVDGGAVASGGAFVDFGSQELVTNGGFEIAGAGAPDLWNTWVENAGSGAIADEGTLVHGGSHAVKLTTGASVNQYACITEDPYLVTVPRRQYRLTFWTRGDGTYAGRYQLYNRTGGVTISGVLTTGVVGTAYAQVSYIFTAPVGCIAVELLFYSNSTENSICYFDDVSVTPYPNLINSLGCLLKIKDSSGNAIQGIIKAAGTGETLGNELLSGFTNSSVIPYDTLTTLGLDISSAIKNPLGSASVGSNVFTGSRYLVKIVRTYTLIGGTDVSARIGGDEELSTPNVIFGTVNPAYATLIAGSRYFGYRAISQVTNFSATGNSVKQVLTPSATGVTIVNSKGGVTYNWINKSTLFNYTSATFTYEIFRLPPVVVATADVTQSNFHADLTTDNAFVELIGVDLTAYQTGKYLLGIYNKTGGYGMLGHISSVAPAGETFDSEGITIWTNGPNNLCEVFTLNANGHDVDSAINSSVAGEFGVNQITASSGALFYYNLNITKVSGDLPNIYVSSLAQGGGTQHISAYTLANGANTKYFTLKADNLFLHHYGGLAFNFSSVNTCKRVLDPPSTGARILSTKGGAGRAWYYTHASFSVNDTAGQTYKIYYIGD